MQPIKRQRCALILSLVRTFVFLWCCFLSTGIVLITAAQAGTPVQTIPIFTDKGTLGYTTSAVSLSKVSTVSTTLCTVSPSATMTVSGMPAGASVRHAILWWASAQEDSQVTLAGTNVLATKTWNDPLEFPVGAQTYFGYSAEVTGLVSGNGTYTLSNLSSPTSVTFGGGCLSGAMLVVVYDTPVTDPNRVNRIDIFEGFQGIRGAGGASGGEFSEVMLSTNLTNTQFVSASTMSWQGNDISEDAGFTDSLTINGNTISNTSNPVNDSNNGSGAGGSPSSQYAVDFDSFDISSIAAGTTSQTFRNTSSDLDYVIIQGFIIASRGAETSDAPVATYGLATHGESTTLRMGALIDHEVLDISYAGDANASADDNDLTDDEDGVTIPTLTQGQTATITAKVSGAGGYLQGWIDWNGDGSFDNTVGSNEIVSINAQDNITTVPGRTDDSDTTAGQISIAVTVPASAVTTQTFARFRWSTTLNLDSTTSATDGEVEDYAVTVSAIPLPTEVTAGRCSATSPSTQFWQERVEWTSTTTRDGSVPTFDAIRVNPTYISRADAFTFGSGVSVVNDITLSKISGVDQSNFADAYSNGDYLEYTIQTQSTIGNTLVLAGFSENGGRLGGDRYKMDLLISEDNFSTAVRLHTGFQVDETVDSTGSTFSWINNDLTEMYVKPNTEYKIRAVLYDATEVDGVVSMDDFRISFDNCADRGDAPYAQNEQDDSLETNAGAHYLPEVRAHYIGTVSPDAEFYVTFDDNTSGVTTDEEAGVILPNFGAGSTVTVDVPVVGANGKLNAWIDWNKNKTFEASEKIATDAQLSNAAAASGTISLSVPVPADAIVGDTYARFRWSPNSVVNATDNVVEGEVEDYAIKIAVGRRLAGTIYEDINADSNMSDQVARDAVSVTLYKDNGDGVPDAADIVSGTTTTDTNGRYNFVVGDGNYWVVVDSKTVSPSAGYNGFFSIDNVWAEQTWGAADTWGGLLCDSDADSSTTATALSTSGACFGGRNGDTSDDASALDTAEHVAQVALVGADVTGVDFGFSFNAVTNTNNDGDDDTVADRSLQGSLRQFIQNANAVSGANSMHFVPAVPLNAVTYIDTPATHQWWKVEINAGNGLASITDSYTSVDGTAYSYTDGITVRDTNLGTTRSVTETAIGVGSQLPLAGVPRPELEIHNVTSTVAKGLAVEASNATIKSLAIYGFGQAGQDNTSLSDANIYIGSVSGWLIDGVYVGVRPDIDQNALSRSYSDRPRTTGIGDMGRGHGVLLNGSGSGSINNTNVVDNALHGIFMNNASSVELSLVQASDSGFWSRTSDGLFVKNSRNINIQQSLFVDNWGAGIDSEMMTNLNMHHNKVNSNRNEGGIRIWGHDNSVTQTVVFNNKVMSGITVVKNSDSYNNYFHYNNYDQNFGVPIDLIKDSTDPLQESLVTANDGVRTPNTGNNSLDYPVMEMAVLSNNQVHIKGYVGTPAQKIEELLNVEIYLVKTGDDDQNGEVFLGDGKSERHGEGYSFNNNCSTTADGNFYCIFGSAGYTSNVGNQFAGVTTDSNKNTSEFGVSATFTDEVDYGDAPADYGSDATETFHALGASLTLGATVDAEKAATHNAAANGDDIDGTDDEDALTTPLSVMTTDTSYSLTIPVNNATGRLANLVGWIDFDGNKVFDTNEAATVAVPDATAGNVTLTWSSIPADVVEGSSYLRLRLTTDTSIATGNAATSIPTTGAYDGEVEDYAITIIGGQTLSGTVFEDINYGGGVGRDQISAVGAGVNGAVVELYDSTGAFVATTVTVNDGSKDGSYTFENVVAGNYYVRVISDTISSTRTGSDGSELPVQTFRSNGTTAATAEVGGRDPAVTDGGVHDSGSPSTLNTTSFVFSGGTLDKAQAQSIQPITVANTEVIGIDFGYNFDTIVNVNDAGQGSLRQFILNSNLLTDIPNQNINAGQETSIFMIPDGTGYAGTANHGALDLTAGGLATIATGTGFDAITDHFTALDASTQNGASCSPRTLKIVLDGSSTAAGSGIDGFTITGNNATVRGFSIGGYDRHGINLSGDDALLVCNHVGLDAAGTTATPNTVNGINVSTPVNVQIGDGSAAGMNVLSGNTQNGVWIANSRMINITNNRIGVDTAGNSAGNNSFGIRILNSADITIGDGTAPGSNIIANNGSDGLYVDGATDAVISRNSLYSNGGLGIDLVSAAADVTLNDADDTDTGPNGGLNFPQLTRVVYSGSDLIIQGCAPTGSTVELFEADVSSTSSSGATAGDNRFGKTQDYGEGEVYITSFEEGVDEDSTLAVVNCSGLSDADGNNAAGMSPFQWRMALPAGLQVGDKLTATATLAGTGTSEFSAVAIIAGQDYGDAPSSYNTTLASDGARHDVINNVYLGSVKPDVDSDGQPSTAANSDGADEDGIASFGALTISDSSYSVVARVNNSTSNTATLIAWIDFDRNGRFDADEAAIRTVSAGASGSDITLNWSSIPLDIQSGDTYLRVRLTTDSLNNREPDGPKLDGEVEDYPITITTVGVTVSGRVFNDVNVNAANDSGEVGVTQLPVVLYDTINKVCVSTRTDGSGAYAFEDVVPGTYQVYEASRESVPVPRNCGPAFAKNPGSYRSTMDNVREAFTVTTSDITGQDFGDVKLPVFEPDNTGQVLPGNVLFYAHKFTTPAKGSVSFSSVSSGNKSSGWSSIIYRDANCDGKLNQTDGAVPLGTGSLAVEATDNVCLINKVYAPANVAANDQYVQNITADFDFGLASTAARDLAGNLTLQVRDVTTAQQVQAPALPATPEVVAEPVTPAQEAVPATPTTPYIPEIPEAPAQAQVDPTPVTPAVGPSRLELRKTVKNITQGTAETDTVNSAEPGNTLEYRIYYSNTGTGPLSDLVVNDTVPLYTELKGVAECGSLVSGMSCTASPLGLDGDLKWSFEGDLLGGSGSSVSYRVTIDDIDE